MSKVTVEKIEITIGRKTISLSPAELRELREVLDSLFPKETQFIPSAPIIIERPSCPRPWRHWDEVWCDSSTGKGTLQLCATGNVD